MEMIHLNVGRLQTNCYILWAADSTNCVVVDPGDEAARILQTTQAKGLTLQAILLTHGHFDHVGAVKDLNRLTGCDVYLNIKDLALPEPLTAGPLFYTHSYGQGDTVTAGGLTFRVLETPGHTVGSVCLLTEDTLLTGDTLFEGTCGRTDLPTGSWGEIIESLKMLAQLPGDYRVCPGHGCLTTMSAQRAENPCIRY